MKDRKDFNSDSHPRSIAIGYFNQDTQLDFVVACTGNDTIDIFLGYDKGNFKYQTQYSTDHLSRPISVAVGNFDNVTGVDIAVANYGTNSISIFLGFNNGSFIFKNSFSTDSSRPLFIAVGDFNNDDRIDIAVVNSGIHSVGIFFGFGDGYFVFSKMYSTGYDSLPKSLAIADLNKDNQLDIVVANSGTDTIGIFFGYKNGTFTNQTTYYIGMNSVPLSVAIADINNDSQLDMIVANSGMNNISIIFGYRNGSFARQETYSTGLDSYPESVAIGHFNLDNQLDIIVTDSRNGRIYVLPGYENGTFPLLSIYFTDSKLNPCLVMVDDFNNDSRSDALIVNDDTNNVLMLIDYEIKPSLFYTDIPTGDNFVPVLIGIGDINNDSLLDIVVADNSNDYIGLLLGYGDGTFSFGTTFSAGNYADRSSMILDDFNNDDQLDIAMVSLNSNYLSIFLGYGNGTFSNASTSFIGNFWSPRSLSTGDINNDNCLDIVFVDVSSDTLGILFGYCNGTFVLTSSYKIGSDWKPISVVIDDFNDDNRLDLAIGYFNKNSIRVCLGNGNGTFPTYTMYTTVDDGLASVLTTGDFNNDNYRDIAVSIGAKNRLGIFYGDGNGNFGSIEIYLLEYCLLPTWIIADDFNRDNQIDIAVLCFNSDNVVIRFGNNNGNFPTQSVYAIGNHSWPIIIASGDFNSDNQSDIAVVNAADQSVGIFLSYYHADFAMQTKISTGSSSRPSSVAVGDFNNDNILDMAIMNSGNKNIGIRLGFGNGSFDVETTYSTGQNSLPQSVNIGDFNKDNHLDLVITDSQRDSINIFFGNGHGTFGKPIIYPIKSGSSPIAVTVVNLNNDHWLDLVFIGKDINQLGILYGYNYADFDLQQTYYTGNDSYPSKVIVGDINNDDRLDIIVSNEKSNNVGIFLGYGNGTFATQVTYSTGNNSDPSSIALADFNNDNCLDIAVVNTGTDCIGILLGHCNGTFDSIRTYPIGIKTYPIAIAVGDVNNDHLLDIVVVDFNNKNIGVFVALGNGNFSAMISCVIGPHSKPTAIRLGDFNNDSCLDIVVCDAGTDSVTILYGYGNGSFIPKINYSLEAKSFPISVAIADFNNDNQLDIAVTNNYYSYIGIFLGFGNGSFSIQKSYALDATARPTEITVGYFNNDKYADIAAICSENSAIVVLFGTDNGNFLIGKMYPTSSLSFWKSIAYGDFNNDNRLDFVISNAHDNSIDIYHGHGTIPFGQIKYINTGFNSQPQSIAVGDFNNDNRSDIVIANYGTDNISILIADETDNYENIMTYSTGNNSRPYAIVLGHFNDDNQLDIAIANSGSNDIIIFQGYGNGSFEAIQSYSTGDSSFPCAIIVSDFNNDERIDLAIANYQASNVQLLFGFGNGSFGNETLYPMNYNSRPYALAVGDFNNDTWIDIAVANSEANYVEILLQTC